MADPQEILSRAAPYLEAYQNASNMYGQDLATLLAQGYHESRFNPNAVSPAGAVGIAQFMPGTASDMGLTDPTNPQAAIDAQARYMQQIANQVGPENALAAYNAGPGNVLKYGGVPPFAETQNYVKNINSDAEALRALLAQNIEPKKESATTLPGRPSGGKMSTADKIASIMGALSSLGGLVATTAGAFKGVPVDYGAQATKTGTSLLESIAKKQKQLGSDQKLYDAIVGSDMDTESKRTAINLINAGFSDDALNLIRDAYSTKSAINKNVAIATDPRLLAAKKAQDTAELEQFKQKEEYKAALDKQIINADSEALSALQEKEKTTQGLTNQERIQKNMLEAKHKLKSGEDSPFAISTKTQLINDIKKEMSPVQSVTEGLMQMDAALNKIPAGRFEGNIANAANWLTGKNTAVTEYKAALAGIESLASRLSGQTGVLTDTDLDRMKAMYPKPEQTLDERKASMKQITSFLNSKIQSYRDALEQKEYGKDYLGFFDKYTSLGGLKKYLPSQSKDTPKPEAATTPESQASTNDPVLEMGRQLGFTVRKK